MALTNGKHIVNEIDGIRCTIVEDKADLKRVDFLKDLLTFNKFEVKVAENPKKVETDPVTYTVGVTDVVFNPIIAIYEKSLFNRFGNVVTPNFWNQISENAKVPYWTVKRPILGIYSDECI